MCLGTVYIDSEAQRKEVMKDVACMGVENDGYLIKYLPSSDWFNGSDFTKVTIGMRHQGNGLDRNVEIFWTNQDGGHTIFPGQLSYLPI